VVLDRVGCVSVSAEVSEKLRAKVTNVADVGDRMEIRIAAFRGFGKVAESWLTINKSDFKDEEGKLDDVKLRKFIRDEMRNFLRTIKKGRKGEELTQLEVTEDEL